MSILEQLRQDVGRERVIRGRGRNAEPHPLQAAPRIEPPMDHTPRDTRRDILNFYHQRMLHHFASMVADEVLRGQMGLAEVRTTMTRAHVESSRETMARAIEFRVVVSQDELDQLLEAI